MSAWQDLYLPLKKGLDLSTDAILSGAELKVGENVDWENDGPTKGRPSRLAPDPFTDTSGSTFSFASTGLVQRGLIRVRDAAGERPGLVTDKTLFEHIGSNWVAKGTVACMQVDRPVNFKPVSSIVRHATTQDFGLSFPLLSTGERHWTMLTDFAPTGLTISPTGSTGQATGTGARCGTTTAVVTIESLSHSLLFTYRTNGGASLTTVTLATDAGSLGDALTPVLCSSNGGTSFWVAYATTTADQYKVLRVDLTGNVQSTFTGSLTGLAGLWVDNSAPVTDRLCLALTNASGLTLKVLSATTIADLSLDSTVALTGGGVGGAECVVGVTGATTAFYVFRQLVSTADGDLQTGTVSLTAGTSASARATYYGGVSYVNACVNWGICHQPVVLNGRIYLTLVAAQTQDAKTGTWLALDVTDPTTIIVARGPADATIPYGAAAPAIVLPDGSGWTFPTLDWSRFSNTLTSITGLDANLGVNRVRFSSARAVLVGESTIISGSVPHVIQRHASAELGFPFLAGQPGFEVVPTAGGAIGIGNYTLAACWRWTDETGTIHRSAPSPFSTVDITSGNNTMICAVTNPVFTEKVYGQLKIELYCTQINPETDAAHYLIDSVTPTSGDAITTITLTSLPGGLDGTPPTTPGTETLYTDGGAFAQYHVPADGGVAVLGRRVWLASATTAYASKLLLPGSAPGFNDEGSLQVNLPAGAGRIMALEAMDDKLVIFCTRGVFALRDGGPDNIGQGLDFGPPERLSDLGIAGPRSTCLTPHGIVFVVPSSSTARQSGPWLLSRDLQLKYLGQPIQDYCASDTIPEVVYSPEREAVFMTYSQGGSTGVVLMDLRTGRWAVWLNQDAQDGALRSLVVSQGSLWTMCTEPASMTGAPGTDAGAAGDYAMRIRTSHLYSNGQSGVGWTRVRGIRALGPPESGAHTLTVSAVLDQFRTYTATPVAVAAGVSGTTWPSNRQITEWRLPTQKCASIQVELSATPATAQWSAIALQVAPLATTSPSKQRG